MFLIVLIVVILSSFKKSDNQINFNKWKRNQDQNDYDQHLINEIKWNGVNAVQKFFF